MAQSAAFHDPRFPSLSRNEAHQIDIEVSVLSPLKKIDSIDEFKLGRDGIYIIKGRHHGTFLPQVAEETGWNTEEFLGHCARDKAGIGWDGWKDADLYTYQTEVGKPASIRLPRTECSANSVRITAISRKAAGDSAEAESAGTASCMRFLMVDHVPLPSTPSRKSP